jgi:hypothetical protein
MKKNMKSDTIDQEIIVEEKVIVPTQKSSSLILVIILVIVTALAAYFYSVVQSLEQTPDKANQEKVLALVEKVGKLIDLPQGETPVMDVIADTKPLAGNPFFAKAKVGDEVLFYPASRKAFLYDPVMDIIVEVQTLKIS